VSALVVDTSSWISYFAGRGAAAIDEALAEGRLFLPPIVAAELLSGRLPPKQRGDLEDLLASLPLCRADLRHWFRVGRLRHDLARKSLSVSTPDAHVAQCAIDLRGELLTEDRIFGLMAKHCALRVACGAGA
jgi:tRNA(fMet)-specific endonuclease VapC